MMRIIVEVGHPAHVHLFRHAIHLFREHGHKVKIVARKKDVALQLLDEYGLEYTSISTQREGTLGLMVELLERDWRLFRIARVFDPDVFLSLSMCSAHVATLLGKTSIVFDDTEHARLERVGCLPFATVICTPDAYKLDLGHKQVRYKGYHELAYLHPNRFTPNPKVLSEIGLTEKDIYFIVRFVSWGAAHDVGYRGFSDSGKRRLIAELGKLGRVIITSEAQLPPDFEPYRMSVSPAGIHDLLAYSSLYIGEGATMASEAALLGVPSIYVNPLPLGYIEDEGRYGLLYRLPDESAAIERAIALASTPDVRAEWQCKRQRLLQDKIDVTAWMVDFVERYPGDYSISDV